MTMTMTMTSTNPVDAAVVRQGEETQKRAEFEAWVRTKPGGTDAALSRRDFPGSDRLGQYVNPQVEFAWQALCAFRLQSSPAEDPIALRACLSACDRVIEQGGIFEGIDFHALKKGIERGLARSVPTEAAVQTVPNRIAAEAAAFRWLIENRVAEDENGWLQLHYHTARQGKDHPDRQWVANDIAWEIGLDLDALVASPSCERQDHGHPATTATTTPEGSGKFPLLPEGYVAVPKRLTRAMQRVLDNVTGEDGWSWAEILMAAEATTVEEDEAIRRFESLDMLEIAEQEAALRAQAHEGEASAAHAAAPEALKPMSDNAMDLLLAAPGTKSSTKRHLRQLGRRVERDILARLAAAAAGVEKGATS